MSPNLSPSLTNLDLLSIQRGAKWLLAALLGMSEVLLLLLIVPLAMFAEMLLPRVVEFCLVFWQALSVQVAYRLMFPGYVVSLLSVLAFCRRL